MLALSMWSCSVVAGFTHVDNSSRSKGKIHLRPGVFVHLGQADQICARSKRDETAAVDVFINLIKLPPQDVKIVVDHQFVFWLTGDALTLHLDRVGVGPHVVEVYVAYRPEPYVKSFSVWGCWSEGEIQ